MNNDPCPHCNPTGVFKYGDERCELCHGRGYLPSVNNELINQIRELLALYKKGKLLKLEISKLIEKYDKQEQLVFEMMFNLDVQSLKIEDRLVYRHIDPFPSIKDQDAFFEFLRENGEGGIIKEIVHPKTLKSWFTEYIQDHEDVDFSDMLKVFEKKSIRIRKA